MGKRLLRSREAMGKGLRGGVPGSPFPIALPIILLWIRMGS